MTSLSALIEAAKVVEYDKGKLEDLFKFKLSSFSIFLFLTSNKAHGRYVIARGKSHPFEI